MPPKGGNNQLLADTSFGDSRISRSSKYAAGHEHAVMSGRGDRESDHGGKRQPRRRASEDKTRAAREDGDDGDVPATLSFIPPKNEKVCNSIGWAFQLCLSWVQLSSSFYYISNKSKSSLKIFVYAQLIIPFFSPTLCRHTMKGSSMRPRRVRGGADTAPTKLPERVYR